MNGDTVDYEMLVHLTYERAYFNKPIIITSGFRCPAHNNSVGGAPNSQHLYGRAVDSFIEGISPQERYRYYDSRWKEKYGIGLYIRRGILYFDTRSGSAARWMGKGDGARI